MPKDKTFCSFFREGAPLSHMRKQLADLYLKTEKSKTPEKERAAVLCVRTDGAPWLEGVKGRRRDHHMTIDLKKYCNKKRKGYPMALVHSHPLMGLGLAVDDKGKVHNLGTLGGVNFSPRDKQTLEESILHVMAMVSRNDGDIVMRALEDVNGKFKRCKVTLKKDVPYTGWLKKAVTEAGNRG